MTILTALKEKITIFHILSIILAILFVASPVGFWFLEKIFFTVSFIHESGHAYFALFFGADYIIIHNSPPFTYTMRTDNILEGFLILLGGIIFTTIFFLTTILLVLLIFRHKRWQYRKSINFGTDTIGFHVNVFLFTYLLVECVDSCIPYVFDNGLTDMGKIFSTYLHMSWIVITNPIIVLIIQVFLALPLTFSLVLVMANSFYCLMKKATVKYKKPTPLRLQYTS